MYAVVRWTVLQRFYKANFSVDEQRVNDLFQRAHELNLSVEKRCVLIPGYNI